MFGPVKKKPTMPPIERVNGDDHGEHWYTVLDEKGAQSLVQSQLEQGMKVFTRFVWKGHNIEHGKVMDNDTMGLISNSGAVRTMVVIVNGSLWTAIPVSPLHEQVDVKVKKVRIWKNGIEGWLDLVFERDDIKASLTAFDPFLFIHRGSIDEGSRIALMGLAYSASIGIDHELAVDRPDISSDGKVRIDRNTHYIVPVNLFSKRPDQLDFSPDVYRVRMKVDSREGIDIFGDPGYIFKGSLFEGKMPVFPIIVRADHIQGEVPEVGMVMECHIWLQASAVNCRVNGRELKR